MDNEIWFAYNLHATILFSFGFFFSQPFQNVKNIPSIRPYKKQRVCLTRPADHPIPTLDVQECIQEGFYFVET